MKKLIVCVLLILFYSGAGAQQEKKFSVSPGGTLEMNLNFGDIYIETWNKNEVVIRGEDDEAALRFSQSGNTIKGSSDYSQDIHVSIPQEFSVVIGSNGGDITVKGSITGKFIASTAAGSISFRDINGEAKVNSGGGDIIGNNILGKAVLNTAGGDITVGIVDGDLNLNTAGGDIRIERMKRSANVNTGGGNIILGDMEAKGSIRTGGGDVRVNSALQGISLITGGGNLIISNSKGDVKVVSGGGDIKLNSSFGIVDLKTGSGNVIAEINPPASGKNIISNGSGDVKLVFPDNAKATVKIISRYKSSERREIISDFELTTSNISDKESVDIYQINGGGGLIEIKNRDGKIELRKRK